MEELFELRTCIEKGHYADALVLVEEMEEMSKDDKINKIESFLEILLIHLIKQHAENRSARSWEVSIQNAAYQIDKINRRRKSGGYYLTGEELKDAIEECYQISLKLASIEAFGGALNETELARKVDERKIKKQALGLLMNTQTRSQAKAV